MRNCHLIKNYLHSQAKQIFVDFIYHLFLFDFYFGFVSAGAQRKWHKQNVHTLAGPRL